MARPRTHRIPPGYVFGRLTVIVEAPRDDHGNRKMQCRCECGQECEVHLASLIAGLTRSCRCLQQESRLSRKRTHE